MPKLRQPIQLQKLAIDHLLENVLRCCDRLSVAGYLDKLREAISVIKIEICSRIPWFLVADFCDKFLDKFHTANRPESHHAAALELIMDTEIVGLRCRGPFVRYLDAKDGHRLRKLEELDLTDFSTHLDIELDGFYLNDLRTFIFTHGCTDQHLRLIGQNCPNLQVLKVVRSYKVTDEGIRALYPCSKLRVVDFSNCSITHKGLDLLLSVHNEINELVCRDDFLFNLGSSLCPAMNRLIVGTSNEPTPANLHAIIVKFPNLKYFELKGMIPDDLTALKSFDKLEGISIFYEDDMLYDEVESSWENIKELLKLIGENMTTLKFTCWNHGIFWRQEEIDFIFKHCPNVEHLKFDHGDGLVVIPPFPKLKELIPNIAIEFESIEILSDPTIEFEKLVELETLWLHNFEVNFHVIESIMLDNVKFPKLSVVETIGMKPEDLAEIERVARSYNLDFKVNNDPESNWYVKYRFGGRSSEADDDSEKSADV